MTQRERYLKIEQERQDLTTSIAGLPQQIIWAEGEGRTLEDEVIRRELLGEDVPSQKRELEKRREDVRRWKLEVEGGQNRARVMFAVLQDLRERVVTEELVPAHRRFGKAAKALVQAIRAAAKAEAELAAMRLEIGKEFDTVGARNPIEQWEPVLLLDITRADLKHPLVNFVDRMKSHGYDV
jgi:hypothetical protein